MQGSGPFPLKLGGGGVLTTTPYMVPDMVPDNIKRRMACYGSFSLPSLSWPPRLHALIRAWLEGEFNAISPLFLLYIVI